MANSNFSAKDIHVFTLYLSRARMIFSEELSSEERMPLPSSIVDGKEAAAVMKAFLGTDTATQQTIDDSNYVNLEEILDEIFVESDNSEKLEILSHCYSATGLFSKIYEFHGSGQGDFITVLSAAPSEARAADSAYEVEDMAFPPEDDDIYEDILENEDTDADTAKLAKIMQQMRKKAKLTKDDMRTLVDAWKKSGSWPNSNEHKMSLHIKRSPNFRNIRWNGSRRPSLFTTDRIPLSIGNISYLSTPDGVSIERLFGEQNEGYAGADRSVSKLIGLAVDLYKPTNDEEFAAALSKFLPTYEIYPGTRT